MALTTLELSQIDLAHGRKYNQINRQRDAAMADAKATVQVAGVVYQADPNSEALINNVLTTYTPLGALPEGYEWIAADNSRHPVTLQELAQIAAAIEERKRAIWFTARDRKDALAKINVNDPDVLETIAQI